MVEEFLTKFEKREEVMTKRFYFYMISCLIIVFILVSTVRAQEEAPTLMETLQQLSEDAAKSYLNPVSSAYGADLNSGWFHRAPEAEKFGVDLEFGLVVMGSFFDDANKHFSTTGTFRFRREEAQQLTAGLTDLPDDAKEALINEIISHDYSMEISGATIIGSSEDSLKINFIGQNITFTSPNTGQDTTVNMGASEITLPVAGFGDLADLKMLPLLAPQFSIGTIFGTQATFRYLPTTRINDDLGDFSYFGFGIQHNPAVWLPLPLPVDLGLSFATQKLTIGELFETKTTAFGLNVSKEIGFTGLNLTPYAGYQLESSTMRVTYNMILDTPTGQQETQKIDFEMEGENKSRLTVGLGLRLLLININADYSFGKYNSASVGINLRF